jgi:8-oxo-dGTP pyrophosphatase MutT (NUDIX family)
MEYMKQNYDHFCNNCGKNGHLFHQCKIPITSFGVIAFRIHNNRHEFLMIRRKDTLGYIDFMRGKYSIYDKHYIINMMNQMTLQEKENLLTKEFDELWKSVWGDEKLSNQYKTEEIVSKEKFLQLKTGICVKNETYSIASMINECSAYGVWTEPEWGFPKGRRNYQEKDYECALREFSEETGYNTRVLKNVHNILPFEEIFTGSNYKSYKHKYYLMYMPYENSNVCTKFEESEVSEIAWKTYDQCIACIRPYNLEKMKVIRNIYQCLLKYKVVYS